ncbi:MAG TPA: PD-(D/E)XK nuclease family protein [Rickettsiales bacterium]|nr:PD-(D/E)XK nuclease family protein [Rickettsiales bacterium]
MGNKNLILKFCRKDLQNPSCYKKIGNDIISGQIDRLTITEDKVFIIDYKNTNYLPKQVPEKYKKQLELYKILLEKIYPDKVIECYILWTSFGKIEKIIS